MWMKKEYYDQKFTLIDVAKEVMSLFGQYGIFRYEVIFEIGFPHILVKIEVDFIPDIKELEREGFKSC